MDKELKEAKQRLNNFKTIKILYGNTFVMHLEQLKQLQNDIETALNYIDNSIPKETILNKIRERQFELQQEYMDFEDDIKLNTLQELWEEAQNG